MSLLLRVLLVVVCCVKFAAAQELADLNGGSIGAYFTLKQLRTTGSVLHVVAHPDDEDGAFLAYCARGLGARTMLFSITRGEGGANLISNHFFDELGVLRTLEHQKAASYYGNELFYSRAADYGYSKTLEEAMKQWDDGQPILAELVEVIRREKPTLIVSRFRGDPRDGHGHHQMAGVLSRLAFELAADPKQFPVQIEKGLSPWQAKRLFIGQRSRGGNIPQGPNLIQVPTGTYEPLLGRSYAQIARFGLGFQRSQGISGHDGTPGPQTSTYLLAENVDAKNNDAKQHVTSLFSNIDTSLSGLLPEGTGGTSGEAKLVLTGIDEGLENIWTNWQARTPSLSVAPLATQLNQLRKLMALLEESGPADFPAHVRQQLGRTEQLLQEAIANCAGLKLEAWATHEGGSPLHFATPESTIQVHTRLANQSSAISAKCLSLKTTTGDQPKDPSTRTIEPRSNDETRFAVTLSGLAPTRPYWRRESIREPIYSVEVSGGQRPAPQPPLAVMAEIEVAGTTIELASVVQTRWRHPELGHVSYPVSIAPALSIQFPLAESVLPASEASYTVPLIIRSALPDPVSGTVRLELPDGWSSSPAEAPVSFRRDGEEATLLFEVQPADRAQGEFTISATATVDGKEYGEGFETVSARDLGRMNVYRQAVHRVRIADIQIVGEPRIGYIAGSGDNVAESLAALDLQPQLLSASDLASADLGQFDVILVGVRAYAVREDLRKHNARLLAYVKDGGVLIVQYQTPEFDANFGPYPYVMGRRPEEVSEEDAAVTILQPNHLLFREPNKISQDDFDGWVEQRGSKFWSTWDQRYIPLLECHDTGQAEQEGGMLFTRYGDGVYIYSAYAWYRQLPNGVPGAYRIFANMLSLPVTIDQ